MGRDSGLSAGNAYSGVYVVCVCLGGADHHAYAGPFATNSVPRTAAQDQWSGENVFTLKKSWAPPFRCIDRLAEEDEAVRAQV